jgi:hypothetical protein
MFSRRPLRPQAGLRKFLFIRSGVSAERRKSQSRSGVGTVVVPFLLWGKPLIPVLDARDNLWHFQSRVQMKNFDLNIDKILENWEVFHAVRELIANAIVDEQILTNTQKPMIFQDEAGWWHVRDFGRGLRYQDLIQTENPEKLDHANLIGKFGIGLKDALATFDLRGITVLIRSRHGDISLARVSKHSFEELVPDQLSPSELAIWKHTERILEFVGGRPSRVSDIRIYASCDCISPVPFNRNVTIPSVPIVEKIPSELPSGSLDEEVLLLEIARAC